MAIPQKKNIEIEKKSESGSKDTESILKDTNTSELIVALCGPIGSPIKSVRESLELSLKNKYGYDCQIIRLSEFIEEKSTESIPQSPKYEKTAALIAQGNNLREKYGASILADLAIAKIRIAREEFKESNDSVTYKSRRICYIIDSIKNQSELDLLRQVYREILYVVGVFSPSSVREKNISLTYSGVSGENIKSLMEKDSSSSGKTGQTVSDTFPQSDFFLRMDTYSENALRIRVERFLDLVLGVKIITPTADESAMYAAASAAGNSACLSRQVGAAVTSANGQLLSVGWNDVPKPFGGLYQSNYIEDAAGESDYRCHNKGGKCFNDEEKSFLAENIIDSLKDILPEEKQQEAIDKINANKKIKGLIEFSRAVHAEMHAILNALKISGEKVQGGNIYVTTYPCHGCARHIIAAGISNVYYIEPYKKSLAIKLHDDAISETESDKDLVRILPYEGVAPSRYFSLFRMGDSPRKKAGAVIRISPHDAVPRSEKSLQSLPVLEGMVVKGLKNKGLLKSDVESKADHGSLDDGTNTN